MRFARMDELLRDAQKKGYAVPAFNVFNLESIQAVVEAANEERAPVIVMVEQRDALYAGLDYVYQMMLAAQDRSVVPLGLHLDHGSDFELLEEAIELGFSSVMIDGSLLPFAENIQVTRAVTELAAPAGVSVEGELGHVGGADSRDARAHLTDPALVAEFVELTKVQALAVAIGTAHGVYSETPKLSLDCLAQIAAQTTVPLVLHGGSGTPDGDLQEAIKRGICKINVGTDIRKGFVNTMLIQGANAALDVREILHPARSKMKEIIRERIGVFGAAGRA